MNLDGSWSLKTSSSAEEMFETLKTTLQDTLKLEIGHQTTSQNKFGTEVAKLRRPKISCTSSKNCTFEVNLKFDLKKNAYIFQVVNIEHVGHDIKRFSTAKKYSNDLTEADMDTLHIIRRAESSIATPEKALRRTFPGTVYDKTLTKREMVKARPNKEDSGDSNMELVVQCGQRCQARGGKFVLYFNRSAQG
eukprot:snap_masked-scaffold_13-processed-gene-6.42-mRNA-1 protein AED:1.00 eAED:1.00 QI:0/0/0/0/1/1/2/0/191